MPRLITTPPENEILSTEVQSFSVWYKFKEGTANYPEKGEYTRCSSAENAQETAKNWNEKNPDMDYYLVPVRVVSITEEI